LEKTWTAVSGHMGEVLRGEAEMPDDVIPFDAASSVSEEEQVDVMIRLITGLGRR
jgi:hypothetical protein